MILAPTHENIEKISKKLISGDIIIFPTDTVYGMGCIATNDMAINKIYNLKNRNLSKQLLINASNITMIKQFAKLNKVEENIIKTFMPGEITIILNVKKNTPLSKKTIKDDKIGIRIPKNKTLIQLIKLTKQPIISTSCNKSDTPPIITAQNAQKAFPKIDIIESNENMSGTPSTILEIQNNIAIIHRTGNINIIDIEKIIKQTTQQMNQ